jgi:SSS family solute:Na+ symporter
MVALTLMSNPSSGFNLLVENGKINYDSVMPMLMKRYFTPGLIGVGVTSLVAMFMAGMAGNMSSFNAVWTYDIYHSVINKNASHQQLLKVGRIATVAGILLSIVGAYIARSMPTVIDYLQAISSMFLAPSIAVILLGMFSKRITPKGGFWGFTIGTVVSVALFLAQEFHFMRASVIVPGFDGADAQVYMAANFWRSVWTFLLAAGVAVTVSFFTEPRTDAELEGYVKGLVEKEDTISQKLPFYQQPAFWAGVTFVILVAINIYFW